MSAPTLFDQLADAHSDGRRFGVTDRVLCPADEHILDVWAEHGIPADLSTIQAACEILVALWTAHQRLKASLADAIATDQIGAPS